MRKKRAKSWGLRGYASGAGGLSYSKSSQLTAQTKNPQPRIAFVGGGCVFCAERSLGVFFGSLDVALYANFMPAATIYNMRYLRSTGVIPSWYFHNYVVKYPYFWAVSDFSLVLFGKERKLLGLREDRALQGCNPSTRNPRGGMVTFRVADRAL